MAQTEIFGNVHVVAYRQNTPDRSNPVAGYYHRSVVERRILEENILYQAGVDVGVDFIACLLEVGEGHLALEHYQRACL